MNRATLASGIFAAWLRTEVARGVVKRKLAEASGVSRTHLDKILDEQTVPGIDTAEAIARALGTTLGAVLGGPHSAPDHGLDECARRVCKAMETAIPGMAAKEKDGAV